MRITDALSKLKIYPSLKEKEAIKTIRDLIAGVASIAGILLGTIELGEKFGLITKDFLKGQGAAGALTIFLLSILGGVSFSLITTLIRLERWKKEALGKAKRDNDLSSERISTVVRQFADRSRYISYVRKNPLKIDANFLRLDRCTIMIWVLVPEKGVDLRDAPHYRYLIAHKFPGEGDANRFSLRYSPENKWEVVISNNKDQSKILEIDDGLSPGWHHFLIAWDRAEPKLEFFIDRGSGGNDLSGTYLSYWPDIIGDLVTIGAWVDTYPGSFCDTKLFGLWILDKYLEHTDPLVDDHFNVHIN